MAAAALVRFRIAACVLGVTLALGSACGCGRGDAGAAPRGTDSTVVQRRAGPGASGSSASAEPARGPVSDAGAVGAVGLGVDGALSITLRPRLQPRPGMSVLLELRGSATDAVQALAIARSWAGVEGQRNVRELTVDDGRGPVGVRADESTGRYVLDRPPAGGHLRASYFAAADEQASRFDLHVDGSGIYGVGHAFLLMPELGARLEVRLRWDLSELGSAEAASSFGVGQDVRTEARPAELANSIYLAGPLVVRDGGFGERLVVLGEPSFDTAQAIGFCSNTLDAARRLFEPDDREAFTFIFVPRPHLGNDHDGASLHRSFVLWFDQDRSLDARLRILIAHEIVHRWIGGTVRLVEPSGADAVWFSEGFATHYARSLLYRRGLIEAGELLGEIQRSLAAEQRAYDPSVRAAASMPSFGPVAPSAMPSTTPRQVVDVPSRDPSVVHHGALYAAQLEAELRRTGGRSLEQLLARLVERGRATNEALSIAQWRQTLVEALGSKAGDEFDRLMVHGGAAVDPPSDAFDRCFVRLVVKDAHYELGFDPASIAADPPLVRGVVPGSAAERAGLRDGDLFISGHKAIRLDDPGHDVSVLVAGDRGTRLVRYSPNAVRQLSHWQLSPKCER